MQLAALKEEIDKLREAGYLVEDEWGSIAFVVPKKGPTGRWRMVVDLRAANGQIIRQPVDLPSMADLETVFRDKTVFAQFDFLSAFYPAVRASLSRSPPRRFGAWTPRVGR